MKCCPKCFISPYLIEIISKEDSQGDCDFCKSQQVSLYPASNLYPFFSSILDLYVPSDESEKSIAQCLKSDLGGALNVFSEIVDDNVGNLLEAIFAKELETMSTLLKSNVALEKHSLLTGQADEIHNIWNDFKDEIKNTNRFHIQNTIDLDTLKDFFNHENLGKEITKDTIFYRCRISDSQGYAIEQMGNPPSEVATAGRANPKGISYLYVADSIPTALYETRASLYDYVSVGEFKVIEDLKILNLKNPKDDPIPWAEKEEIENFLIFIPFIQTLQAEISLPIRKRDKTLDYIPTQYISEFIKSLGFDGLQYRSSLYSEGFNLAIFKPEKLKCINSEVYEIRGIKLDHEKLESASPEEEKLK